jgi:hypothetical protein
VTDNEKRRFHRVPFQADAQLVLGSKSWPCQLIDISMKGALIEAPANCSIDTGDKCVLFLRLDDEDAVINMNLSAAHVSGNRAGFNCEEIDAESLTYLRKLVELNLGDPELVYRELGQLGKFGE